MGVNIQNANAEYLIVHTHTHTHTHIWRGKICVFKREKKEREMKGWRKMEREERKYRAGTASQCLGNGRSFV